MTTDAFFVLHDAVRVRELTRVLEALEHVGSMPLVFKGAALAHTHYEQSWLRPRADADLLIPPSVRLHVFDVLGRLGYDRRAAASGDLVSYQATFVRHDGLGIEHRLDIHWRIANPQLISQVFTHDELLARAVTVPVGGRAMRVPSSVDALLIACVHRAAHHDDSEDPIWLQDIHLIAARLQPEEWERVVGQALQRAVAAVCVRGLNLAVERFETRVPDEVMMRLTAGSARQEPSAVYLRKDLRPVDRLAVDLRALGPTQAARLIREHLFPSADYMTAKYSVGHRALLPAYYALRAFRGASKWLRPRRTG